MPCVRYLGWTNREPRSGMFTSSSRLRHTTHAAGTRLAFRGYPGKPTGWKSVDEEVADVLRDEEQYEVKE